MEKFVLTTRTQTVGPAGLALGEIFFEALSRSSPENDPILLVDAGTRQEYTAQDILRKSIEVAGRLHELGVRTKDMVGMVSGNRVEYIWTVLGCFYLGARVNPLNPDYIPREIMHAFEISMPKFVITESDKVGRVIEATSHLDSVPTLITFEDLREKPASRPVITHADPVHEIALVLCSSGTTGLPKGVAMSHEAIKNCLHHVRSHDGFGIDEKETTIAVLPFYHIMGLLVVLASVLFRAKSVVMQKFKPEPFVNALEKYQVTKLFIVPPLALFLAKAPIMFDASSITDVICGAAPLGPEVQNALERKLGVAVRQVYGMTEVCAISLSPPKGAPPGSSGTLLPNLQAKICDVTTHEALPALQTGELCVKSPCLMSGYLGNERATQETFDSDGYLRTGDIAYYDEQGHIYIVDRLKELIKYKGFQVPPAEIEDILIKHSEIKDAAVIGVEDDRDGELAKAFVVLTEGSKLTPEAVKDWVAENVSIQKRLHGGVEFIQNIPKSASGKILRKELKKLTQRH